MMHGWRNRVAIAAVALLVALAGCASNRATGPAKDGGNAAAADLPPRLQQGGAGGGSESGPPYSAKDDKPLLSDAPVLSMEEPGNAGRGEKLDSTGKRQGAGALTEAERRAQSQSGNRAGGRAQAAAVVPPRTPYAAIPGMLRVQFEFDRDELTPSARRALDQNADWMLAHADVRVRVEGHCDERGSNEYNLGLGQRRADRVTTYLITKGVHSTQMLGVSFGEEVPIAQGHDEAAWSQNRRVDFSLLDENLKSQAATPNDPSVLR
jgi:peptidoglycan-associated lipoprotein